MPVIGWFAGKSFPLSDGGCRFEGAKLVGIRELLALDLGKEPTTGELLLAQASIDLDKQHLPPAGRARLYQNIMTKGVFNGKQTAEALNVSEPFLSRFLGLTDLAPDLQEAVNSGDTARSNQMKLQERRAQESQEQRESNMLHAKFEKLYQRYFDAVRNKAYARCGDTEIAHDAAQDAFLQLWKVWLSGEKIAQPLAWLCRVAGNKVQDMVKSKFHRNGTCPPAIMNDVASQEQSVLHMLERREDAEKFRRVQESLPAEDRELLDMRLAMTRAEIAAMKGWSIRQVKRKLARLRVSLRPLLEEYFPSRSDCRRRKAAG